MYQKIIFPLLARTDSEQAHERALSWLEWAQRSTPGRLILSLIAGRLPSSPVSLFGLTFPNVLGVAAGYDKDARVVAGLVQLGFGHVEVGTLTPRPQEGNPKPRVFRLTANGALINRMGFPNQGVEAAVPRLAALSRPGRKFRLGVSLGKQKETPLVEAWADYIDVMRAVFPYADYLAINVSSPNTPGLRELQGDKYLSDLLGALQIENENLAGRYRIGQRPLLVKIAPDLSERELEMILTAVQENDISGIVATNSTVSRDGLEGPAKGEEGGLSGRPLRDRSTEIIAFIARETGGKMPVIGVGGVQTAVDARAKLDAGASLVQLYTGMVFEGPQIAGRILRGLQQ
jgi:dihydroorotate dehydrogenase